MARGSVAVLLGVVLAVTQPPPALAATWSVGSPVNPYSASNTLAEVDLQSATSGWAVGWGTDTGSSTERPIVSRWNGSTWSTTAGAASADAARLSAVDGDSTGNVWVAGTATTGRPFAQRWNGVAWSVATVPLPNEATGGELTGVKSLTAGNAWAVGSVRTATAPFTRTLVTRWNGASWAVLPSPNPDAVQNLLVAVDAITADDVWAVGNLGHDGYGGDTTEGMVLRWNGSSWAQLALPAAQGGVRRSKLHDVVVLASDDVWVVGTAFSLPALGTVPYYLHWDGQGWQQGTIPGATAGGQFLGVTALAPTNVYAAGVRTSTQTLIARWNGSAWSTETTPSPSPVNWLNAISATAPGAVWAVGGQSTSASEFPRALAVRTNNG